MITVKRTFDYELIKQIVTHPDVYKWLSDDGSPTPEDWEPAKSNAIYYVLVESDGRPVGVFMCTPQNFICYEGHTALLPEVNGQGAEIAQMAQRWIFENTPCLRFIGNVPTFNRRALRYVQRVGWRQFGVNPSSFLKDGVLYDQIMLGVNKADVCH